MLNIIKNQLASGKISVRIITTYIIFLVIFFRCDDIKLLFTARGIIKE